MKNSSLVKINQLLKNEIDPAFKRRAKIVLLSLDLDKSILDLGCGRGFYLSTLNQLNPRLELTGVDINQKYLKQAAELVRSNKIKLIRADATQLPFKNNQFDQIIASEILEHLKEDQMAIKGIYRVLKPGGKAIFTVPSQNYPFLWDPLNWLLEHLFKTHIPAKIWWLAGIWADHQRLYSKKEIEKKIKKSGLKIIKTYQTTHHCFPFAHFVLYGLGKNLVEKGLFKNFNRFQKKRRQSLPAKLVSRMVNWFDRLNEKKGNFKRSVNIIIETQK